MSEPANFGCCVPGCGAKPFPTKDEPQCWDLMRLDADMKPVAGDDESGRWYCSKHFRRVGERRYEIAGGVERPPAKPKQAKPSGLTTAFADLIEDYEAALDLLATHLGHGGGDARAAFDWSMRRAFRRLEDAAK
jgi:hypothetical protein